MSQKQSLQKYFASGLLLLCVFANPLEQVAPIFKWIDELICLVVYVASFVLWLLNTSLRKQLPHHLLYFIPFVLYMVMQLLGSLIFRFQPRDAVIIDALTHTKFWLALYGCYLLGGLLPHKDLDSGLLIGAKISSSLLFILFLLEQFGIIFPDGLVFRNLQCSQMMYLHPSYVSAIMAFLLAVLLSQWEIRILPYIIANLIVMIFTFRAKAYGAATAFLAILVFVIAWKQKIKLWHIILTGSVAIYAAWDKIAFYFVKHNAASVQTTMSARSAMLNTGLQIMKDYFPLGTGFATFASHQSIVHYSPVYSQYGLDTHPAIGIATRKYVDDSFWPIVFAQSGAIGLIAFLSMLLLLCIRVWKLYDHNHKHYAAALFALAYILIISIAEPAFNNQTTLPLALLLGYWLGQADQAKERNIA